MSILIISLLVFITIIGIFLCILLAPLSFILAVLESLIESIFE